MIHTKLYSGLFPANINDLRSPSNYPFVGMLYDDSSLLYSYEPKIKQNYNEILYKAPLVQDGDYTINRTSSTSIYITSSAELTPTNDDYNILQFNYSNSDEKILNGYYEPGIGQEFYCLQSDMITELVLPNGIEEIDALAFNCPNLTTVTLPTSIKRFRSVTYTDIWSADVETIT